jgi:hypothetical protein
MTTLHALDFRRSAALFLIAIALLLGQPGGHAEVTQSPLKLFKNYFLTGGDYEVAGVGLRGQGVPQPDPVTGVTVSLATGSINLSGVPDTADISAAFLYWASLEPINTPPMSTKGYFRGAPIEGKAIGPLEPANTANGGFSRVRGCWGSGGGGGTTSATTQLRVYRADVLKNFPVATDGSGKLLVNGAHTVKLPDSGGGGTQSPSSGNQVRYVEGASLVVVYRQPTSTSLRAVVIYDGAAVVDQDSPSLQLNIGGYYDAVSTTPGKITHLVGDGDLRPEVLTINDAPVGVANPFSGSLGSAWDNTPYPIATPDDDGIKTAVGFTSPSIDCLAWAGVIARVDVEDYDKDGIPDKVETGAAVPADGEPALPDFAGMGADWQTPDLFVELGFFTTAGWPSGTGVGAHDHRPTTNALTMVWKAFKGAGVNVHFDVGTGTGYPAPPVATQQNPNPCASMTTWTLGCAIVQGSNAKGGEFVTEAACIPSATNPCQFPSYPGTVGWKSGYQYYRDAPVEANGTEMSPAVEAAWEDSCEKTGVCPSRRRFDANRHDFFHYSLWAHALGLPQDLCLNTDGTPNVPCQATAAYHTPTRSSGFGDVGGADSLITLHAFGGNFNGSDTAQAGTFMHELGHNFERRHGGELFERNCKPNYISVMSYLFQVHGMNGGAAVDFSGRVLNSLDEKQLTDSAFSVVGTPTTAVTYPTRWYAPLDSAFIQNDLGVTPAAKHCDGSVKQSTDVFANMVRVDGLAADGVIDWLNDGVVNSVPSPGSDVNFDGGLTPKTSTSVPPDGELKGSDDWSYILAKGLRQLGSRPNMGLTSLDMSNTDLGRGDPGRGDPGRGDPGRGDPGRGDPGRGDPGRGDPGADPGAPDYQGDLTLDRAADIFNGPTSLTATKVGKTVELKWRAPQFMVPGVIVEWTTAYRVEGGVITKANWAKRVEVGKVFYTTTPQRILDTKPLNGKLVTYIVVADFLDSRQAPVLIRTRSGISNPVSIIY